MQSLRENGYAELVDQDESLIEEIFESVFTHRQFTGRSGGMYAYEGLALSTGIWFPSCFSRPLENFQIGGSRR